MTDRIPRVRNRRGEGDRLRSEIVAAATELIDQGSEVTLRAVARGAGVSAPSIYAHFVDLGGIRDAVLEESFAELDQAVAQAMADNSDGTGRLRAGCLAYVRFGWDHRRRFAVMFAGDGFAPDAVRTFDRIVGALADCIQGGAAQPGDPRETAFLLWAGLHGMATLQKPARAELRRLGTLDRIALTESLVRRIAGLR